MADVVTLGETMVLLSSTEEGSLKYVNTFNKQIGNDSFGQFLLSTVRGKGVDVSKVKIDNQVQTAIYFNEFHEHKDPIVYYYITGSASSRIKL